MVTRRPLHAAILLAFQLMAPLHVVWYILPGQLTPRPQDPLKPKLNFRVQGL